MENDLLTLDEVVKYLKIPKSTVYKLAQNKELPFCKIGKQLRFKKSSLDAWLREKESAVKSYRAGTPRMKKVLLIDDDELVLKSLARFLKSHGFNLELAQSAEEALEKAEEMPFDLIITDIRMPHVSGVDIIKAIRRISQKNKRPLAPELVITGYSDTKVERELEGLGVKDYLYKPFSTPDLLSTIERALT